ncbi:hypothetical protein H6P81_012088 [Aristolochia fimbriata]|uniref:Polysaccharide biosynthesis domain-containing protein n=1 Tax=Aristolochia fimbriata TaxID=158543 RepID=A0AAV7ECY1_ARIFI|nr:hypothetical protein H6P81_012088 [Aristolochia fimbriata]
MRTEVGEAEAQRQRFSSTSPTRDHQTQMKTERETRPLLIKKLPFLLLLVLSAISILRFIRIATNTASSSSSSSSSSLTTPQSHERLNPITKLPLQRLDDLTPKELRLLTGLVSRRAPCNLLVFGIGSYSPLLVNLNSGGTTLFLEDDSEVIKWAGERIDSRYVHSVNYPSRAERAFELLREARANPACAPHPESPLSSSTCPLALTSLPDEVFRRRWDVVVVDGPRGDCPEAPGRMEVIYSTGVMSRAGKNMADVVVHDVDRMIEKWYSWEFLCQENMVAAKGKLWHFRGHGLEWEGGWYPPPLLQVVVILELWKLLGPCVFWFGLSHNTRKKLFEEMRNVGDAALPMH